jgi:inosine/xanthosine triphosphatase
MRVALGSLNPVKIEATRQAFSEFFPSVEVIPVDVKSGVNAYPMTREETLQGAINRMEAAASQMPEADFAVGIEGGSENLQGYILVRTLVVIKGGEKIGVGGSAAYESPEEVLERVDPSDDEDCKNVVDEVYGQKDVLKSLGGIGVLTQKRIPRTEATKDAVICALSRFVSPQYYSD